MNCGQVEDTDCDYTVDDSSELKGTVPADDYTGPEGTVPAELQDEDHVLRRLGAGVEHLIASELAPKENVLSQLEASATILQHATLVEGEVRKFLENHWKDIQY